MTNNQDFAEKILTSFKETGVRTLVGKGEYLTREGEVERNFYLVESGAVRVFYLTEHEEHVIRLGYAGSFINSLSSFIKETPSEFYIEAIRKTAVRVMNKHTLMQLAYANTENLQQYTVLLEALVTQQIDREIDLLIASPSERLQRVLSRSPDLFQHVPLKYIASYLRMTPETLSRIRNS